MFSIIVPSYNRKDEIPALLESLTKQTSYNFDVVIVDDCSKEPVEVTQAYPFAVKVIRNETNQGAANAKYWRKPSQCTKTLILSIIRRNVKW